MFEFLQSIAQNQVFNGIVGGSVVCSALYLLKWIPSALWNLVLWRYTSELVIFNEDPAFDRVSEWLTSLDYSKRARRLRLTATFEDGQEDTLSFSPGLGRHLLWYKARPIIVERVTPEEKGGGNWKRREDISITTLGSSPKLMHELVEEITKARQTSREKFVTVYLFKDYWRLVARKAKRSMDSVVLSKGQQERIVRDIQKFLGSQARYLQQGIPYRRGILLEGPPGCGKTSLVLTLAGYFSKPIYVLNLGSLKGDNDLIEAVTGVPERGILLIEDIDAAKSTEIREPIITSTPGKKDEATGITLSGLLNAIDGTFAKDGRILIMTTNHPDKIDPALLRPGRADRREHIGLLEEDEVKVMCERFLNGAGESFSKTVETPISPAELQEQLLQKLDDQRQLV